MRVTQQMLSRQLIRNIQKNNEAMANYQQQLSSGKKIEKPSDDPIGAVKGLAYRSSLIEIEQYQNNAEDAMNWTDATDEALGEVTNVLQRIRELTVQGSNDTNAAEDKKKIASEIKALQSHIEEIANATLGGRYLFAGTDTDTPPYRDGILSTNQEKLQWNIGKGASVTVNVSAPQVFGALTDGKNMFETIQSIAQTLESGGNPDSLLSEVDDQIENVLAQRGNVGANQNLLELTINRLSQTNVSTQKVLSDTEDADMAQVITQLMTQETVMKAAMTAGAKIIQPTLADFLR